MKYKKIPFHRVKSVFYAVLFFLPAQNIFAQGTEHAWLFGAGRANVLDTYLSPLEYTGPTLGVFHRAERTARWGKKRVTFQHTFSLNGSWLTSPTEDATEWDGNLTGGFGWLYNWRPLPGLRLAAGGLAEAATGFTYNTRNGNNPAQGRLSLALAASGVADYAFRIRRYPMSVRAQVDFPLIGGMFTPNYGQSYYEIFSLGHTNRNVRLTHPFNAPSLRTALTMNFAVGRATLSVGWLADVRQSHINHLKRHLWNNQFVVGYVRRLQLLPPSRP